MLTILAGREGDIPVGPLFVAIFAIVCVLIAIAMVVLFLCSKK